MIWSIRERRMFGAIGRDGRSSRSTVLWCKFLKDPDASPLRVAFSIGRSVGPAVTRNRLRRQLRVLIEQEADQLGLGSGWLLVGARPSAVEHTFARLRGDVRRLLTGVVPPSDGR